ncbi:MULTISPECIES: pro-sigmaK processing inhibitor BofA family protein [Paenibacillus]|jgi:inhibitor of the pro-sigma K processing machinery|uniref:Pro-sigmaK processing inhibitor BofA family protein n=1 Tax=Paenibacillus oceani TaxID=2772510 RepID=A0A927C300_9BACL|nr:pro-sigmaK processing inhibitor BofA family protein [Paenibacillus oceani]MBD2860368.1 pro-sigmaK processing inhibitor BofA family protein [Paenibacillus oceani]
MRTIWLGVLLISSILLVVVLMRRKHSRQWIGYAVLHIVVAAFLLYFVNLAGSYYDFRIPVNMPTVATVLMLGVPGLLMLVGLKFVLF